MKNLSKRLLLVIMIPVFPVILILLMLILGCARVKGDIVTGKTAIAKVETVPEGCIQATAPGAAHSYQSKLDPDVIEKWKAGDRFQIAQGMYAVIYKNPDVTSDIPVAMFLVRGTSWLVAYAYLEDSEPKVFAIAPDNCYKQEKLTEEDRTWFKKHLLKGLNGEGV